MKGCYEALLFNEVLVMRVQSRFRTTAFVLSFEKIAKKKFKVNTVCY